MTIVVGFIPAPEGHAALHRAALEAQVRQTSLVVVASHDESQEKTKQAVAHFEKGAGAGGEAPCGGRPHA